MGSNGLVFWLAVRAGRLESSLGRCLVEYPIALDHLVCPPILLLSLMSGMLEPAHVSWP